MFTHHKLKVYQKALEGARSADILSAGWATKHCLVDHFWRASESVVLNIAEGARLPCGSTKVLTLDYAIGSALECAACLDIAVIKELLAAPQAFVEKHRLWEITRMLVGLRKSWCQDAMNEEPDLGRANSSVPESEPLFHHEQLRVYRSGLEFMGWFNGLPGGAQLIDRTYRQLEKAATGLVLNIAEGNGRYSELDHRRFLDLAGSWTVKAAAYLDLLEQGSSHACSDMSVGRALLGGITAMLSGF